MSERVYLDYNASAPVRPQARDAALAAMDLLGNASSAHAAGRAARGVIEDARRHVSALAGGSCERVIFTSGATEANGLALASARAAGCRRLIIAAGEHQSLREAAAAGEAPFETLPLNAQGQADLDWLQNRLSHWDPADGRPFAALMAANNETGVLQPIAAAAAILAPYGGWLHVDAVAALGRIGLDLEQVGASTLTLSAHKIGGLQGCGALLYAEHAPITRQIHGGGQERRLRSGTENLPGIAAFAAAAQAAGGELQSAARTPFEDFRAAAARRLKAAGAVVIGEDAPRAPHVLCVATPGFPAALQVMALDLEGVMVSAGAACSSGTLAPSPALQAMGRPELATFALRASGGWSTPQRHWERFADVWLAAFARRAHRRPHLQSIREVA